MGRPYIYNRKGVRTRKILPHVVKIYVPPIGSRLINCPLKLFTTPIDSSTKYVRKRRHIRKVSKSRPARVMKLRKKQKLK